MKITRYFSALFGLLCLVAPFTRAAQVKISALPATTTMTPESLIEVSYWNGSGFVTRKMTYAQLGAQIATNTAAISTNAAKGVLAYPGMAQHVKGRDFFNLWNIVSSNNQSRIGVVGDSVVYNGETVRGVRKTFESYMARGGWGSMYAENNAGTPGGHLKFFMDNLTAQNTSYAPGIFYGMQDGQVSTSIFDETAPATDRLSVYFHADASFGTLLVETNSGAGWGTRATINAAFGSHIYTATNFALSPKLTYSVRLTSAGTNVLDDVALTDSTEATNSIVLGRVTRPGALLAEIVTNAGFHVWVTNYNPQTLVFEVKDPGPEFLVAANHIVTTYTNRDVCFVTCSPNLPDEGAAAMRQVTIDFCRSNDVMCFDKFALFTPTNYWYSALPFAAQNIWNDGAHLGAMGIRYASAAFATWFGCGPERFAMFGLAPLSAGTTQTNDLTKANLAGGNTFTGNQIMPTLTIGAGNGTLNSTGTLAGVNLQNRTDVSQFLRVFAAGNGIRIVMSSWGTENGAYFTNRSGKLSFEADPAFHWSSDTPAIGSTTLPWWLVGTNSQFLGVTRLGHTPLAQIISPSANTMTLWCSNAFLYSIHNVAGTYTTNLIQAP